MKTDPPSRPENVHVLECVQYVARPLAEVFPFFAEPENLARITPPWLAFRVVSEGPLVMHEGLRIEYRVSPLFVPQRWESLITLWDPPRRFVDEQVRGPYRYWHHLHEFRRAADGVGTEIRDRVTYALPFGPLGALAHPIVRRQLEAIFAFRRQVVDERFGARPLAT